MTARSQALSQRQQDSDGLRITLWRLPPNSETGWHVHAFRYVVVPIRGGNLTVEDRDGSRAYSITTGESYSRPKGVEHNIANDTSHEISFVEVELIH